MLKDVASVVTTWLSCAVFLISLSKQEVFLHNISLTNYLATEKANGNVISVLTGS